MNCDACNQPMLFDDCDVCQGFADEGWVRTNGAQWRKDGAAVVWTRLLRLDVEDPVSCKLRLRDYWYWGYWRRVDKHPCGPAKEAASPEQARWLALNTDNVEPIKQQLIDDAKFSPAPRP